MNFKRETIHILFIGLFLFALSCTRSTDTNNQGKLVDGGNAYSKVEFDTTFHDFGTLVQGEQVSFTFKFRNTGNSNLLILDAYATCGCTVPYYSKEPISPGDEGKIEIIFDSDGKVGTQYKTVTIKTNTENSIKTLSLRANVTEKLL